MYTETETLPDTPAQFIEASSGLRRPSPPKTKCRNEENFHRERKNLIRLLMKKVDALRAECEQDVRAGRNLLRLISTLKSRQAVVNKPEYKRGVQKQDHMADNQRLTTYIEVRNCDLERFSEK
jgi:hypothetical protein